MRPIETKPLTFQTRFARRGSTVGTRLTVRETVAVDTLARLAISRMFIGFSFILEQPRCEVFQVAAPGLPLVICPGRFVVDVLNFRLQK